MIMLLLLKMRVIGWCCLRIVVLMMRSMIFCCIIVIGWLCLICLVLNRLFVNMVIVIFVVCFVGLIDFVSVVVLCLI